MHAKQLLSCLISSLVLLQAISQVQSYHILAVFIFPGKSHFMMSNELVRLLVKKGHTVTHITPFSLAKEKLGKNYNEILIPLYEFWSDLSGLMPSANMFDLAKISGLDMLELIKVMGVKSTEFALKQPELQELIYAENTSGRFDLLLAEQFYNEAMLGLALKFNIPYITASTVGYTNFMSQMTGIISPWSYVPHAFFPLTDHMTFIDRLKNSYYSLYDDLYRFFVYLPLQNELLQRYFKHLPTPLPSIFELERNISAILLNSYMPLTTARPTAFNLIPVGGLHINPPKPLPQDLQEFLDNATDGAIYFSLGTNVRSSDMPPEKRQAFLDVFAKLKQRVLWKFETNAIDKLPPNVMIKDWMPQGDVLAHPNIKLFITHGGLFGTQEAVHYGIPMLGMPVYCDQHLNMNKAVQGGYGLSLHFHSITKSNLEAAIQELLQNTKYKNNIQQISAVFRDRPVSAKENAVFWIEHVIRHRGAPFLRAAGVDLPWYQFYLLDVICFVLCLTTLPLLLVYMILCRKYRKSVGKSKLS